METYSSRRSMSSRMRMAMVHEDNDWGICLVDEDAGEEQASQSVGTAGVS